MEISKELQKEIIFVQNKLKNAIRDHLICMGKLNDDPNSADILNQIHKIQLKIVSLGKCQKQVIQRLRKEVEAFEAENANGGKVSVASLLGLNNNSNNIINNNNNNNNSSYNNNSITFGNENRREEGHDGGDDDEGDDEAEAEAEAEESKHREQVETVGEEEEEKRKKNVIQVKVQSNGIPETRTKLSKEHYEDVVPNENEPINNFSAKVVQPSSVETVSIDGDVVEVINNKNSIDDEIAEIKSTELDEYKLTTNQVYFLQTLDLITANKCNELQNKTAECKRRRSANLELVCPNWELPTKKKRHSYLQSTGSAPQTRQSSARLNGPSPPPTTKINPKSTSTSPTSKSKSLMTHQKNGRPNILRNLQDVKEELDSEAEVKSEPGSKCSSPKNTLSTPSPSSFLAVEKVEDYSTVCIHCRTSGDLIACENCSASYHRFCHSVSPPPAKLCPKCVQTQKNESRTTPVYNREELEEKESERIKERKRNSDLRLQVYELEKRSQLIGQSLQLQQHLRQELLIKQEKTQKSVKRLVDFIKLMKKQAVYPSTSSQPSTSTQQHQVTLSQLDRMEELETHQLSIPSQYSPDHSTSTAVSLPAIAQVIPIHSPFHQSSTTNSPINSPPPNQQLPHSFLQKPSSPVVQYQMSTHNQTPNHISSSKKCLIPVSVDLSPTHPNKVNTNQLSISSYQSPLIQSSFSPKKNYKTLTLTHPSSTITSRGVVTPPVRYPDSPKTHPTSSSTVTTSLSPPPPPPARPQQSSNSQFHRLHQRNQHQEHQQYNGANQMSLNHRNNFNSNLLTTQCSQAITSPIPSPIVMGNQTEEMSPMKLNLDSTESMKDHLIKKPLVQQQQQLDNLHSPNSTNT